MSTLYKFKSTLTIALGAIISIGLSGCAKKSRFGMMLSPAEMNVLARCVNKCTSTDLYNKIGHPTLQEDNRIYYINLQRASVGPFKSYIDDSHVVEVTLDQNSLVKSYKTIDNKHDNSMIILRHYDRNYHNQTTPIRKFTVNARKFVSSRTSARKK